jgi:hypothetical protein
VHFHPTTIFESRRPANQEGSYAPIGTMAEAA